jgi:hypothetical protein
VQAKPELHDPALHGLAQTNVTSSVETQFCAAQSEFSPQAFPSANDPGAGFEVATGPEAASSLAAASGVRSGPVPPAHRGAL